MHSPTTSDIGTWDQLPYWKLCAIFWHFQELSAGKRGILRFSSYEPFFFHRKVDIFSILLSASTKRIWLTRTTSFPSGFHLGSYFFLPLKTKWSCLRSSIVCALLLAFQILSIGALFRACDYLRLKHTNKTHLIVSGPDSGQSMGCQNSCSSGKPAAQGLFRERSPSVVRWFLCSTVWLPISPLKEGRIHHH